ncbi:MAG TPA: helical backbone metal receptor [Thermoanaerobaculia bacterium]|jgi:ABC-type Fe3+-hydroxamate transport system substrate-binding protein
MPPARVVSLCPSITETIVAIGGLRRLAGVTRYCTRPSGMLWGLPRVGGTKSPNIARILDLKPDLVFANAEENRREDVQALRDAGVEVDVTLPKTVAEVPETIRRWGRLLGTPDEAEPLAARIEEAAAGLSRERGNGSFRYAYWIWKDPWMTVSDDTYVADLLSLVGGENVYGAETVRYPTTTPSEALTRDARVQIFASEPYPFSEEKHAELAARLFGTTSDRVFVDGDDFCWHGVRTLEGLKAVRSLIKLGN